MREESRNAESPVPGALGRMLGIILQRLGGERVDRVWIFPPLVRGRREFGLVAVSAESEDPGQRALYTARYSAELTGKGMEFESDLVVEGLAPPDRLLRVMDGVVRRSDLQLGEAREVVIGGEAEGMRELALAHGWGPPVQSTEEGAS